MNLNNYKLINNKYMIKTRQELLNLFVGDVQRLEVTPEITLIKDYMEDNSIRAIVKIGNDEISLVLWNHLDSTEDFYVIDNKLSNLNLAKSVSLFQDYCGIPINDATSTTKIIYQDVVKEGENQKSLGMIEAYEKILLTKKITIE